MRKWCWIVAALGLAGACKKKEQAKASPGPVPVTSVASTSEVDALWALAPEGATFGAVASPRGVASFEAATIELSKLLASAPELSPIKARLDAALREVLGTTVPSLAAAGLSPTKGFAVFATPGSPVVIVPLADRAKFLEVVKGQQGSGADIVGVGACQQIKDVYACARVPAVLATLGRGNLGEPLKLAGSRGDIEVAGDLPAGNGMTFGIATQVERGSFVVRGAVRGMPPQAVAMMANARPRVEADRTAGFAVFNLGPLLARVPPVPIVPGLTFDELARSISGAMTLTVPTGPMQLDVRVPLSDPEPARKLVGQCDQVAPLRAIGGTQKDGVCHLPVPQLQLELDAWVDAKQLRIGKQGAQPAGPAAPLSPLGSELANAEWSFAVFGRGTVLGSGQMAALKAVNPGGTNPQVIAMLRGLAVFNELGIAVRSDGDVVRFVVGARTVWSNPDDVVAKLLAISPAQILEDGGAATVKEIVAASPRSPLAGDLSAGHGGLTLVSGVVGMLAGVAIPAFMDYMKKAKKSEASLQLRKLEKSIGAQVALKGGFPRGEAPLTPARPCCETSERKCFDAAAWQHPVWQELDFAMSEPHLFRYAYQSDGKQATVKAVADLDCDGTEITHTLTGTLDAQGNPTFIVVEPPANSD